MTQLTLITAIVGEKVPSSASDDIASLISDCLIESCRIAVIAEFSVDAKPSGSKEQSLDSRKASPGGRSLQPLVVF